MLSDEWLPRYRLLENFTAKWNGNGNGNAYDRGDYNSSFALCAVELKRIFSALSFNMKLIKLVKSCLIHYSNMSVQYTAIFHGCKNKKLATSKAYSIPLAMCRSKPCKFVKNYFFSIKLLHAHLQYVCNTPAKYQMNILKALGGVDFTK